LELNVYLRIFKNENRTVNMFIDPGPPIVFNLLREALEEKIGSLAKVQFSFVNHQDPDVSTNLMYLKKYNPKIKVLCTEDTWRLISFLGLEAHNLQAVDKFKSQRGKLSTGHTLRFVPTPFCHFRGASMLYDETARILFSGDLFGGLTYRSDFYATSENWHGIRTFHQLCMPSVEAMKNAIQAIRRLKPKPLLIAPQHGALIKGHLIEEFLEKLYHLPVGLDLMQSESVNKDMYIAAINEIIDTLIKKEGSDIVDLALQKVTSDGSFPDLFEIKDYIIQDIKIDPNKTFQILINALMKDKPATIQEHIKNLVLKASVDWNLPLFDSLMSMNTETSDTTAIEQL